MTSHVGNVSPLRPPERYSQEVDLRCELKLIRAIPGATFSYLETSKIAFGRSPSSPLAMNTVSGKWYAMLNRAPYACIFGLCIWPWTVVAAIENMFIPSLWQVRIFAAYATPSS